MLSNIVYSFSIESPWSCKAAFGTRSPSNACLMTALPAPPLALTPLTSQLRAQLEQALQQTAALRSQRAALMRRCLPAARASASPEAAAATTAASPDGRDCPLLTFLRPPTHHTVPATPRLVSR